MPKIKYTKIDDLKKISKDDLEFYADLLGRKLAREYYRSGDYEGIRENTHDSKTMLKNMEFVDNYIWNYYLDIMDKVLDGPHYADPDCEIVEDAFLPWGCIGRIVVPIVKKTAWEEFQYLMGRKDNND